MVCKFVSVLKKQNLMHRNLENKDTIYHNDYQLYFNSMYVFVSESFLMQLLRINHSYAIYSILYLFYVIYLYFFILIFL